MRDKWNEEPNSGIWWWIWIVYSSPCFVRCLPLQCVQNPLIIVWHVISIFQAARINPDIRPTPQWPDKGVVHVQDFCVRYRSDLDFALCNISFDIKSCEKVFCPFLVQFRRSAKCIVHGCIINSMLSLSVQINLTSKDWHTDAIFILQRNFFLSDESLLSMLVKAGLLRSLVRVFLSPSSIKRKIERYGVITRAFCWHLISFKMLLLQRSDHKHWHYDIMNFTPLGAK